MSRIDIKTLVMAFEKRIEALDKNPPDKVPMSVIMNLLERSIDEVIKEHFLHIVKLDMKKDLEKEFKLMKNKFIKKTLKNILNDEGFRSEIENRVKLSLMMNIKKE